MEKWIELRRMEYVRLDSRSIFHQREDYSHADYQIEEAAARWSLSRIGRGKCRLPYDLSLRMFANCSERNLLVMCKGQTLAFWP